jgi:hypothetical protein
MNKYLILYQAKQAPGGISVAEMLARSTPEQMQAGMEAWRRWTEKAGDAIVDRGAPLDRSTTIMGGSATATRTSITGYSILQAESMDAAVALMKDHPHFHIPEAEVQILECVPMPGF